MSSIESLYQIVSLDDELQPSAKREEKPCPKCESMKILCEKLKEKYDLVNAKLKYLETRYGEQRRWSSGL